jgi:hypothetical protein
MIVIFSSGFEWWCSVGRELQADPAMVGSEVEFSSSWDEG